VRERRPATAAARAVQPFGAEVNMTNKPNNIATTERVLSGLGGGLLMLNGVRRFSLGGMLMAGAGAVLLDRARSGHCAVYNALAIDRSGDRSKQETFKPESDMQTVAPGRSMSPAEPADIVGEASEESFPSSDPPAWTPTGTPGTPKH
jgi:hypothetical protein